MDAINLTDSINAINPSLNSDQVTNVDLNFLSDQSDDMELENEDQISSQKSLKVKKSTKSDYSVPKRGVKAECHNLLIDKLGSIDDFLDTKNQVLSDSEEELENKIQTKVNN